MCPSLCRMPERAAWNWSTGSWLLALCLAWTLLASASLQPPTPTGLGEVAGPGEGVSQDTRRAGLHPTPFPSRQISEVDSRGAGSSSVLHLGNCPLGCSSLKKAWADPLLTFPFRPEGVMQGERPLCGSLSVASWPNSVVFLPGWLKPV